MGAFWPNGSKTKKPRRTLEFGYRHSRYSRGWHTGWDTNESDYDHNHAAEGGVVEAAYYDGSYGNTVIVRHADGSRERTAHGAPGGILVVKGQPVSAGQRLMVQGTTGMSTGKHNHQEVIDANGNFVDPEKWIPSRGDAPAPAPASGGNPLGYFDVPADSQYYYWHYGNALIGNYASNQYLRGGQTLAVVENPGTGPVRVRAADGDLVWVGTRKNPARVRQGGAVPTPAPAAKRHLFDVPAAGQYWYSKYENALNGNYDPDQIMHGGTREVVEDPGTGPVRIRANDGSLIWVGTRRNPARTYWA